MSEREAVILGALLHDRGKEETINEFCHSRENGNLEKEILYGHVILFGG